MHGSQSTPGRSVTREMIRHWQTQNQNLTLNDIYHALLSIERPDILAAIVQQTNVPCPPHLAADTHNGGPGRMLYTRTESLPASVPNVGSPDHSMTFLSLQEQFSLSNPNNPKYKSVTMETAQTAGEQNPHWSMVPDNSISPGQPPQGNFTLSPPRASNVPVPVGQTNNPSPPQVRALPSPDQLVPCDHPLQSFSSSESSTSSTNDLNREEGLDEVPLNIPFEESDTENSDCNDAKKVNEPIKDVKKINYKFNPDLRPFTDDDKLQAVLDECQQASEDPADTAIPGQADKVTRGTQETGVKVEGRRASFDSGLDDSGSQELPMATPSVTPATPPTTTSAPMAPTTSQPSTSTASAVTPATPPPSTTVAQMTSSTLQPSTCTASIATTSPSTSAVKGLGSTTSDPASRTPTTLSLRSDALLDHLNNGVLASGAYGSMYTDNNSVMSSLQEQDGCTGGVADGNTARKHSCENYVDQSLEDRHIPIPAHIDNDEEMNSILAKGNQKQLPVNNYTESIPSSEYIGHDSCFTLSSHESQDTETTDGEDGGLVSSLAPATADTTAASRTADAGAVAYTARGGGLGTPGMGNENVATTQPTYNRISNRPQSYQETSQGNNEVLSTSSNTGQQRDDLSQSGPEAAVRANGISFTTDYPATTADQVAQDDSTSQSNGPEDIAGQTTGSKVQSEGLYIRLVSIASTFVSLGGTINEFLE